MVLKLSNYELVIEPVHWLQDEDQLPDWKIIYEKMIQQEKISKVRNPSTQQLSKNYPEIKWSRLERNFKKKIKFYKPAK